MSWKFGLILWVLAAAFTVLLIVWFGWLGLVVIAFGLFVATSRFIQRRRRLVR